MATRSERLTDLEHTRAKAYWERMWQSISIVEATRDVAEHTGQLAELYRLRGFDAVHLASVSVISAGFAIVVTWDERLSAAATAAGYAVAPL